MCSPFEREREGKNKIVSEPEDTFWFSMIVTEITLPRFCLARREQRADDTNKNTHFEDLKNNILLYIIVSNDMSFVCISCLSAVPGNQTKILIY